MSLDKMQLGIELETEFFLLSVLLGGGMGIAYDFFRIIRALIPHNKIMTFYRGFVLCPAFRFRSLNF